MEKLDGYSQEALGLLKAWGPKALMAFVVLFVGLKLINFLSHRVAKVFETKHLDTSLKYFLISLISISLKVVLFVAVADMLGIPTTSFLAILGAAGLAVGLALKGTLSNFAGGVLILFLRPFKVGDVIEAQGFSGTVQQIKIFNTILTSFDNKTIMIPNGPLSEGNITNLSTRSTRRVDMVFGIGYGDDLKKAKNILERILLEDSRVLDDPEALVAVSELADSSVNFVVRPWVQAGDYWAVLFDTHEKVKLRFDEEGISIPYPQQDVHIQNIHSNLLNSDI